MYYILVRNVFGSLHDLSSLILQQPFCQDSFPVFFKYSDRRALLTQFSLLKNGYFPFFFQRTAFECDWLYVMNNKIMVDQNKNTYTENQPRYVQYWNKNDVKKYALTSIHPAVNVLKYRKYSVSTPWGNNFQYPCRVGLQPRVGFSARVGY